MMSNLAVQDRLAAMPALHDRMVENLKHLSHDLGVLRNLDLHQDDPKSFVEGARTFLHSDELHTDGFDLRVRSATDELRIGVVGSFVTFEVNGFELFRTFALTSEALETRGLSFGEPWTIEGGGCHDQMNPEVAEVILPKLVEIAADVGYHLTKRLAAHDFDVRSAVMGASQERLSRRLGDMDNIENI